MGWMALSVPSPRSYRDSVISRMLTRLLCLVMAFDAHNSIGDQFIDMAQDCRAPAIILDQRFATFPGEFAYFKPVFVHVPSLIFDKRSLQERHVQAFCQRDNRICQN